MPNKRRRNDDRVGGSSSASADAQRASSHPPGVGTVQLYSRLGEEQHPMCNPVVLSVFFDVCTVPQLKTFRLVCKEWRDLSLRSWRQQAVLRVNCKFKKQVLFRSERNAIPQGDLDKLKKFTKIEQKPFSSCELFGPRFEFRRGAIQTLGRVSFEYLTYLKVTNKILCISYIRDLVFTDSSPPLKTFILEEVILANHELKGLKGGNVRQVQDLFPRRNSTLTTFKMRKCYWQFFEYNRALWTPPWEKDDLVRAVLLKAPNIHTLAADVVGWSWSANPELGEIDTIFSGLDLSQVKINVLDITHTPMKNMVNPDHPSLFLSEMHQLPLHQLHLNLSGIFATEDFKRVFESICDSLKILHTYRCDLKWAMNAFGCRRAKNSKGNVISFPELTELHLQQGLDSAFHFLSLISCPNLTQVTLDWTMDLFWNPPRSGAAELDFHKFKLVALESVRKLRVIPHDALMTFPLTPNEIKWIARVFPNLQDLRIPLTKEQFPVVCKVFRGLRSLHIVSVWKVGWSTGVEKNDVLDDEAIAGLELTQKSRRGSARKPNITDLKELEEFVLEPEAACSDRVYLTDHSVINGFLKLSRLRYLRFNMNGVSRKGRDALREKIFVVDDLPFPENIY